jgi:hypothetical protein
MSLILQAIPAIIPLGKVYAAKKTYDNLNIIVPAVIITGFALTAIYLIID